jgi:hypothetical protein
MRPKSNGSSTIGVKKIGGGDERLLVVQSIHRGVVGGLGADQQILRESLDRARTPRIP